MDGGATWADDDFQSDDKTCTGDGFNADDLDPGQYTVEIQNTGPGYTYISAFR